MIEQYDMAFSLGFSCGTSMALRAVGLQFASYPLDWVGSPGLAASARMIATDFSGWVEKDDLRLHDIRRGALNKHVYLNARTGFGFAHDFSSFVSFDEAYPEVRVKYDRRIARFYEAAGKAKRLLAVYIESPVEGRAPNAELEGARKAIVGRFPGATVDLLYFYEGVGVERPVVEEIAPGLTAVQVEYRELERGQVMHTVDHSRIVRYLKENVSVADVRSAEEKSGYAAQKKAKRARQWGSGGVVRRLVNRVSYRLYRKLEKRLVAEGIVPWEGPLWFVKFDSK